MNKLTQENFIFNNAVDISLLDDDKWDSRDHHDQSTEQKHIEDLAKDISKNDLINPITIIPSSKNPNRYSIIAGRFRVLACKKLGFKTIPAKIIIDEHVVKNENKLNSISYSENEHRLGYSVDEKIARILRPFYYAGYKNEIIIYLAKKIHNYGVKDIPERFLDCMESCEVAPNYLYQIMQTIIQIDPKVQLAMKKANLHINKRMLLTHTKLREHPKIALDLVKKIKGLPLSQASFEVRQAIRDLETEAVVKINNEYVFNYTKRDKLPRSVKEIQLEKTNLQHYLEIMQLIEKFQYHNTGHRLNAGEVSYEPNHVKYSENHRINILKSITPVQFGKLEQDLKTLKDSIDSWLDLIENDNEEFDKAGRGDITN